MTVLCRVWPSISPWNVWDLQWFMWVGFAAECDNWVKAREDAARHR